MGEAKFEQKMVVRTIQRTISERAAQADEVLRLQTPGGRFQVRWDEDGSATAMGQLAFFAEFLEVVSYNPTKPGRPSHVIHTYWIANVRLVLDAEVQNGKAHAARHGLPRLIKLLKALSAE